MTPNGQQHNCQGINLLGWKMETFLQGANQVAKVRHEVKPNEDISHRSMDKSVTKVLLTTNGDKLAILPVTE